VPSFEDEVGRLAQSLYENNRRERQERQERLIMSPELLRQSEDLLTQKLDEAVQDIEAAEDRRMLQSLDSLGGNLVDSILDDIEANFDIPMMPSPRAGPARQEFVNVRTRTTSLGPDMAPRRVSWAEDEQQVRPSSNEAIDRLERILEAVRQGAIHPDYAQSLLAQSGLLEVRPLEEAQSIRRDQALSSKPEEPREPKEYFKPGRKIEV
jgi:hypothetical protein